MRRARTTIKAGYAQAATRAYIERKGEQMTAVPFDTLKYARKLRDAGVPPDQAEGMADALVDSMAASDLATKSDLQHFATKSDLREVELRLTIRMGVIVAAGVGLMLTLDRLFPVS